MVFTTVVPETLELALDRCRWQVELAFKRLKTLLDLDALRTQQNSRLGEIWIRGNSSMSWSSSGVPNATPRVALTCWTDPADSPLGGSWLSFANRSMAGFSTPSTGEFITGTPAWISSKSARAGAACKAFHHGSLR
jgi:hypothetical protein